ncbi:MAG: DUF7093 family protein [Halanaeroarchaeum sp.]
MGLRCSLLGHDFGDVVIERDRDERGEEIVITERELRECRRCDAESIITENTEVRRKRPGEDEPNEAEAGDSTTAAGTPPDVDTTSGEATSLVEEAEASVAEGERTDDDAIILDAEPDADAPEDAGDAVSPDDHPTSPPETDPGASGPENDSGASPSETGMAPDREDPVAETEVLGDADPVTGETDDAITAEEVAADETASTAGSTEEPTESPTPARESVEGATSGGQESPDAGTNGDELSTDSKWPNQPDPTDRSASEEQASGTGSVDEASDDAAFQFGEQATEQTDSDPAADDPSSGIASAGPIDTTAPSDGALDGLLRCPVCDFAVAIARSSNRAGDICPECHGGYLAEER